MPAAFGCAKGVTLYDKRLIELQKEYAHNLLTHRNPYTNTEYRNEPAIAIVEILNENGIGQGYNPPSKFYADELDGIYNAWLKANLEAGRIAETSRRSRSAARRPRSTSSRKCPCHGAERPICNRGPFLHGLGKQVLSGHEDLPPRSGSEAAYHRNGRPRAQRSSVGHAGKPVQARHSGWPHLLEPVRGREQRADGQSALALHRGAALAERRSPASRIL